MGKKFKRGKREGGIKKNHFFFINKGKENTGQSFSQKSNNKKKKSGLTMTDSFCQAMSSMLSIFGY